MCGSLQQDGMHCVTYYNSGCAPWVQTGRLHTHVHVVCECWHKGSMGLMGPHGVEGTVDCTIRSHQPDHDDGRQFVMGS
jgi:hypothetical protein